MAQPGRPVRTFEELYAEIERLPEGKTGEILEDGVLYVSSRPGKRHRRAARACLDALSGVDATLRGTGWWIEVEAEIRFSSDRLAVPHLAGWRVERVPDLPDENPLTVLPDWCCEILSPRTARDDKRLKLPLFARSNVPWSWLIDPTLRLVEVYQTLNGFPGAGSHGAGGRALRPAAVRARALARGLVAAGAGAHRVAPPAWLR